METVQSLLQSRAESPGVAVRHRDTGGRLVDWSWPEYVGRATAHASAVIAELDPDRPPHVAVLCDNSPEMLVALAAAGLGGYVLVGVNNTRRGEALAGDVARSDVQLLLVDAANRHLIDDVDLPDVTVIELGTPEWTGKIAAASPLVPVRTVDIQDPFMMIFTSGTSGDPKAVLVSHLMVVFAGQNLVERFGLTPAEVFYMSMPLFHSNAIAACFSPALVTGGTMVPVKFSASRFADDLRAFGITYMNYVGKPLAYILATPERPDDADNSLRICFGNEASDRDIDEFSRRFDTVVVDAFGSTENAVIITREADTPRGSIGRGLPGVAVYDAATGVECATAVFDETGALANAAEAIGELVNTTGPGFFTGYYNNPEADAERMRDGMFWSGDLAYVDADGWIYLAGRTSDWMRVDGENLAAGPIERILIRLDQISRVAVYGVPDPDAVGDQVMAAVVLRDDAELTPTEFEEFLAAQPDLSPKAWPRYVRIAAELPATATNKIVKRTLAAEATRVGDDLLWERGDRARTFAPAS
ncbi:fatty-acid--CoA ligase FadD1 [Gordonia neofelifaecis]|uniref:Acyl-CoA synthetase n=1 Tax=Gordonia neofelifaecis NRRL B-59395 TaxID=644548 RepID=F1YI34_9ACTN|nr:fatty-acid--CoA ligase FadD1 [Gordonia neofelifaecis]EGD55588.1 acyl-CoA synthetase [Gordonia neofelifaecis NRRL B-59395]